MAGADLMAITVFLDSDQITSEVFRIQLTRGRSLESETFDPGGGVISVRNYDANFNPTIIKETSALLLESGDFLLLENGSKLLLELGNGGNSGDYGEIKLGREVVVIDGAVTVFTGYLEDIDFVYDVGGFTEATLTVRDSLATVGATDLNEWITTEGQLTGARVSALLDRTEVGFPSGGAARSIATGTQPLNSSTVRAGTNALQELQRINRTEYGRLFADAAGRIVFQDRYAAFGTASSATFDDTGTNLPFHGIDVRFGTEMLHFSVSVTREPNQWTIEDDENGDPIYVNDAASVSERVARDDDLIAEYPTLGARNKSYSNLPYQSDDHAYGLAELLLQRFSVFDIVISSLTVKLGALGTSDRATVCGLDIGDVITVSWTPAGTTGAVTQALVIEAVTYSDYLDDRAAEVSFLLSDASDPDYFQVGTDAVDGTKFVAP